MNKAHTHVALIVTGCVALASGACQNTIVLDGVAPGAVPPAVGPPGVDPPDVDRPDVDPPVVDPPLQPPSPPTTPFAAGPGRVRRLVATEYVQAVGDLLGPGAAAAVRGLVPDDVTLNGFTTVGHAELSAAPSDVASYEELAYLAAEATLLDSQSIPRALCAPTSFNDSGCMTTVAARIGRRALRGAATDDVVSSLVATGIAAADAYGDFDRGLVYLLARILQSPEFLYVIEIGDEASAVGDARVLTQRELATRLSLFIAGQLPSDALLDAADAGALSSPTQLEAEARALLSTAAAKQRLRNVMVERLELKNIVGLNRPQDGTFTADVRTAMVEETLQLVDDVVWTRNAPAYELFSAPKTFVNCRVQARRLSRWRSKRGVLACLDRALSTRRTHILTAARRRSAASSFARR
jgi:Protein of unknown function (DUF1592)/Protein of unknown function (DUF1595)/Protein of unknown function (DUF1587)